MSQFIHDATGLYKEGVSPAHTIHKKPYTYEIKNCEYKVTGFNVVDFPFVFIDTPGYDLEPGGTSESSTLKDLHGWLTKSMPGTELDGLIIMHSVLSAIDIWNRRSTLDYNLLSNLCGTDWQKKVILLTTHWDTIPSESAAEKDRVFSGYWSIMSGHHHLGRERYDNHGRESAWKVLQPLVEVAEAAREQRLERELGVLKGNLTSDRFEEIESIIHQKRKLIRDIVKRLGTVGSHESINDEREYTNLIMRAKKIREGLEGLVNLRELEQRLAVGVNQKYIAYASPDRPCLFFFPLFFSVVGRTGSGISQFIHDVTGDYQDGVASGESLTQLTTEMGEIQFGDEQLGTIKLIDTPGFDYSKGDDEYIRFRELHQWFRSQYGQNTMLDGVVYMYNIWDSEALHRSPLLKCAELEDLCGLEWRKKLWLVSSHWDENTMDNGDEREQHLREGYWRFMLEKGSAMLRYGKPGDRVRAQRILEDLLRVSFGPLYALVRV